MFRRTFLQTGGLALASLYASHSLAAAPGFELKIRQITVKIGLSKPFKVLHVSDSHVCLADGRDNERKRQLAAIRAGYFPRARASIAASVAYAKAHGELFLHTGDLEDFVSAAGLDMIRETFRGIDCIAAVGNHEFSQYVGEAREDAAYKAVSFGRVQAVWPNDPLFYARVVNGVNFVAFDNVYSYTVPSQLERLRAEVAKGLPIVLLCHVPFFSEEIYMASVKAMGQSSDKRIYLAGVPAERMANPKPGEPVTHGLAPDRETLAFIEYFEKQPLIKAVLCGHLHWEWSGQLPGIGIPQYVAGLGAAGFAQEVTFV